ncbi:MAG: hypothetical protein ACRDRV_19790 [Pseudonocardiaceae bacterium]
MIIDEDRPKPAELLSLYRTTQVIFEILKDEFQVPDTYQLSLHHIDAAEPVLAETFDIAALTMRKIQALRWLAKAGVETASDVVVSLAADLCRSLDHLERYCTDEEKAQALTTFKHQVVLAARLSAGKGDIAVLR